jgi:hypothetical protein
MLIERRAADCGGVALGIVERVSLFGSSAELRLQ